MKKQYYILWVLLVVGMAANSQTKQLKEVGAAVEVLKKAVIEADKSLLEAITAEGLVYGHSNGKVQNKAEFIAEIISAQPLDYVSIETEDQTIALSGNTAVVRHIFSAETMANGTAGKIRIGNMLIWQKQKGKWKLLARQAYKL
ncbi:MAG TPA: nuclear transport factor 2 family protein [Prolixibacteraceae bacterium]|nr:nuclear transport factor 2 family protein [Prolixibacteraceae bacterium]